MRSADDRRAALVAIGEWAAEQRPRGARVRVVRAARPCRQPGDVRLARRGRPRGGRRVGRGGGAARWSREDARSGSRSSRTSTPSRRRDCVERLLDRRARGRGRGARAGRRGREARHRRAGRRACRRGGRRAHRPRARPRRRRQHPDRAARVRGARRARCSRSTSARSASSPRSSRDSVDEALASAFEGRFELLELPGIAVAVRGRRAVGRQRRVGAPAPGAARGRARLLDQGRHARRRCAATGWSRRRRSGRRATTSRTAVRSWPGASRATSSRSSRRTR